MGVIPLIRQGALGVTTLFSVIVLGISAHILSQIQQRYVITTTSSALGVVVAIISLVTLPTMVVVDVLHRFAFTSMIIVELVWLSILWTLWVATAGEAVSEYGVLLLFGCTEISAIYFNGMCEETKAIAAFSFLNFIILLLYTGFLSVMVAIAASGGRHIWQLSLKESLASPAGPVGHPMTQYSASVHPTGTPQDATGGAAQVGGSATGV